MLIKRLNASVDSTKTTDIHLKVRENLTTVSGSGISPIRIIGDFEGVVTDKQRVFESPIVLQPGTDIWVEAKVGSGSGTVTASFDYVLMPIGWARQYVKRRGFF